MSGQDSKRNEDSESITNEERPNKRARVERDEDEDLEEEEQAQDTKIAPAQASDLYLDTVSGILASSHPGPLIVKI
jgi:hypothetical protein